MEPLALAAALSIPAAAAYSAWRKAPLSLTFAVAIIVMHIFGYVAGLTDPAPLAAVQYQLDLGLWRIGAVHSAPWTYVTSLFLHASLLHLAFNLIFLVAFGPMLEERIGAMRWGSLYVAGGVVGALGFEFLRYASGPYVLVGASGALSAVFGAFGRLYPRERIQMWIPIPLPAMTASSYVILFIAAQAVLALASFGSPSGIAWEAHVVGLAFGFAAAPLAMRIPARRAPVAMDIDPTPLEPLATTRELRQILEDLKAADVPEVRRAWLDKFAATARCPSCGGPLRFRGNRFSSPCGWRLRL